MESPHCGLAERRSAYQNSGMLPFIFERGMQMMSWRKALWATCLAATLASAVAANVKPSLPGSFDVAAIDAYISAQVQLPTRVGLSVAIVKDGKMVLAKG